MRSELVCPAGQELLEKYSMGSLSALELESLEEHLLVCHRCQDGLREIDAYLIGMRRAARALRAEQQIHRRRAGWFPWRGPVLGLAGLAVAVAAGVWLRPAPSEGPPVAVLLQAARDSLTGTAPAARALRLTADLTELPSFPAYHMEVVDSAGRRLVEAPAAARNGRVSLLVAGGLPRGTYFVRLYTGSGELLREFGLRVF